MKPTDAKHTPGPWKATTSYGEPSDEPWMIWSVPRDRALAQCYRISESGDDNSIEQRANAELIASAPTLLAERDALRAEVAKLKRLLAAALCDVPRDGDASRDLREAIEYALTTKAGAP